MTVITLCVAAWITAWAMSTKIRLAKFGHRFGELLAAAIFFAFLAITIGAGIQFTFRG